MKFAYIHAKSAEYPVQVLCDNLGVSRSGYYAWLQRKPSRRATENVELLEAINEVRKGKKRCYGSPRVHRELKENGHRVSKKRVENVMRKAKLSATAKRAFRRTTNSSHLYPLADNLLKRTFKTTEPNVAWVADVTYLATGQGWLYLATVIDLYSRRVVGWSLHTANDTDLTTSALREAIRARRPKPGLIFHSDRGSNYASYGHRDQLDAIGARASMSRRGDCWDNAVAESFFASLRKELTFVDSFSTHAQARASVKEYIENFYNLTRRHSSIGYVSPIEYELRRQAKAA